MLKRYTSSAFLLALAAVLAFTVAVPVVAQDDPDPAEQALEFLLTAQNADGGFTNGWAPESDIGTTADIVVAASLVGVDPEGFLTGDLLNPITFLGEQVSDGAVAAGGAGLIAKAMMAVVAVGKDTNDFAGTDLAADLVALQDDSGVFGSGAFDHCLALLALQNAGIALPDGSIGALLDQQNADGGWGFMLGEASDTNTTALCLQALALEAEADDTGADAMSAGLEYLSAIQNDDGGWPYQSPSDFGTDSDTSSTAFVLQALIAAGEDLAAWGDPLAWLLTMQNDSGAFGYQEAAPDDNILATVAVIPALAGQPLNAWAVAGVD